MNLEEEFQRIQGDHRRAVQTKAARIVIGPSVGRVFAKDTVGRIWPVLDDMDLNKLARIDSQAQFRQFFEERLNRLARKIRTTNPENVNPRIYPGYKWGHATKILCLFLNDMIVHRDFFATATANKLVHFLYVPIDSLVMKRLKQLGITLGFSQIKQIATKKAFYSVQDMLGEAARRVGVPRIWFDDNWGDRQ